MCILNEQADTLLELARRLATDWGNGLEYSRRYGSQAGRCTSSEECSGGGGGSRWSSPCRATIRFDECAHIWKHIAQIWEQGRNLERGVYVRGEESRISRFMPSQIAKPPPSGRAVGRYQPGAPAREVYRKLLANPSRHSEYSGVINGPQRAEGFKFTTRYVSEEVGSTVESSFGGNRVLRLERGHSAQDP